MSKATTAPASSPPERNTKETSLPSATPQRKHKGLTTNSCGNSSLHKRLTRQLAGIMAHLEVHPNDALSKTRVATINDLLRR